MPGTSGKMFRITLYGRKLARPFFRLQDLP